MIKKTGELKEIGGSQNFRPNVNNLEKRENSCQHFDIQKAKNGRVEHEAPPPKRTIMIIMIITFTIVILTIIFIIMTITIKTHENSI